MENMTLLRPNRGHPGHPVLKGYQTLPTEYGRSYGFKDHEEVGVAIDTLVEWAKKQPHFEVKDIDRDYLEAIFFNAKLSIEKAKQRLDRRMQLTNFMLELLTRFDLKNEFKEVRKCYKQAFVPWPTENNYRVAVNKYLSDFFDCEPLQFFRYLLVNIEYQIIKEVATGHIIIADIRDVPMADTFKLNILLVKKTMTIITQGYGARIKSIHIITGSKVFDAIFALLKPALPQKIQKRIYWHNSPDTLTDYIPKDQLPSDYAGNAPSIEELDDILHKDMVESQDFALHLKRLDTYKTNESLRIKGIKDFDLGAQGSFRSLNID